MKKRFAAVLAATAVLGVTTAFAANPFSDVEPSHWAYQSVAQLAAEGVINGYPDGTFKGQNNITRYEMAQMVAKAMANQDRVDAEQNAMINRLADEFSEELNNLGVRVSNLEKKVGNVKVTGDFRLRYVGTENGKTDSATDKWQYRARLNFGAEVNDSTRVDVRVSTNNVEFGSGDADFVVDRAFVTHKFGDKATVKVGRLPVFIGAGLSYDDSADGAAVTFGNKTAVSLGYFVSDVTTSKQEWAWAQVDGKISDVNLGGFWLGRDNGLKDIFGFNAAAKFGKVGVDGEWNKVRSTSDSDAWIVGVGYGDYSMAKKGTWDLKVNYLDVEANAWVPETTYSFPVVVDSKGWAVSARYALAKNVGLAGYYAFARETQAGVDRADYYRADINYRF